MPTLALSFGPVAVLAMHPTRHVSQKWPAFSALTLFAVAAGFWAHDLYAPEEVAPSRIEVVGRAALASDDVPRASADAQPPVSAPAAPTTAADRFRLVGVMAPGAAVQGKSAVDGQGIALIAVGGMPARAFQVGAVVEDDTLLLEVSAFGATLGPRDRSAMISLQVAAEPAQAPEAMATRAIAAETSSPEPLDARPFMSAEVLRKIGSRHPPLRLQNTAAPQIPSASATETDDGRWTAPSEQ